MKYLVCSSASFILFAYVLPAAHCIQSFVPAMFIFGDSILDTGNNNQLLTIVQANFPPYGRDFVDHKSTGRFCNGKLAIDFIAEAIGFTKYQPAYLSDEAQGNNLLIGANFASAASGYYNFTARLWNTISLDQQLENFKEYLNKLTAITGKSNASSIIAGGIYLISSGSSDFLQNFYINPLLFTTYTADEFSNLLISSFDNFIRKLYELGARRIGVTSLPPLGCLPAAITSFGFGRNQCVARLNSNAFSFNNKLNDRCQSLKSMFSELNLVVLDIYTPLYDLIMNPADKGFSEVRRGCCGTGLLETSILCNQHSIGTCANASEYVFWDAFHPSETTNQLLATQLQSQGSSLLSNLH
ncbi:GDSL esterase/lipase At5g22810-like [Hibiscus syriacus]|uniref:GDSL esterase/lipase At5g22810-like n=1 Tax=Hibiscus syriacus TaxID=106335 RepID=UPI0019250D4F|nr:GDSL esterase/lipase At5g22810-like [Hibiscus syriacus]